VILSSSAWTWSGVTRIVSATQHGRIRMAPQPSEPLRGRNAAGL
jgi:hypothetical protein